MSEACKYSNSCRAYVEFEHKYNLFLSNFFEICKGTLGNVSERDCPFYSMFEELRNRTLETLKRNIVVSSNFDFGKDIGNLFFEELMPKEN